jgi:hypothetical protein
MPPAPPKNTRFVLATILAVSLHGAFLVNALRNNEPSSWVLYVVVAAFSAVAITYGMVKASRASRRYMAGLASTRPQDDKTRSV